MNWEYHNIVNLSAPNGHKVLRAHDLNLYVNACVSLNLLYLLGLMVCVGHSGNQKFLYGDYFIKFKNYLMDQPALLTRIKWILFEYNCCLTTSMGAPKSFQLNKKNLLALTYNL